MKARSLFLAVFPLLGFACALPAPRPAAEQIERLWQAHAMQLTPVTGWELRGRLAVRTDDHGGQATLSWQREAARQRIRLNGPLGSGAVRVTQDESGARLEDSSQRVFEAASAEELVYRYTGWQLPLAHLDWWVRGLPVPGLPATRELDDAGRLKILRQLDWELRYEEYRRVEDYDLPVRLTLTHAAHDPLPAIEARFVIDRWAQVK